jgi:hypothetical protein
MRARDMLGGVLFAATLYGWLWLMAAVEAVLVP